MDVFMSTEPGFSWISPSELERRLNTIPLPKKLKTSFTTIVIRWQSSSGSEWTVSRLKSFKDCVLQSYGVRGREVVHKPEWFATAPSGKLTGVFGSLWELAMSGQQNLKAVLMLVNIYTGVSRTTSTDALISEIKSEICQKKVPLSFWAEGLSINNGWLISQLSRISLKRVSCAYPVPLNRVLPGKEGHSEFLHDDIMTLAGSPLYQKRDNKYVIDYALGVPIEFISAKFSTVVGKVGITHEAGLKTRYFAAPNQLVQRALEPLKEALLTSLRQFQWDCTLDQRKADSAIESALQSGQTVHSIDLSKATDNFPWEYQKMVLKFLVKGAMAHRMRHLLDDVVREGWWVMPDKSRVRWGKGQPLGLGPSFPLFTISHGILLYILNGCKWNKAFYVLGDDVVIFDDRLAGRYREVLTRWQVKVSETKSFTSCNIAQFAGKNFTSTGSFWIPKWVPFTRDNLIDLEAWWYPGLTRGMPDHDLINRVLSMPAPYGIGRNPHGYPLAERFSPEMVVEMLLRQERREALGKPSATRVDIPALIDALTGLDDGSKYALTSMLMGGEGVLPPPPPTRTGNHHTSTEVSLPESLVPLMHGTETLGYPYLRKKNKVIPYTLGSLRSWKQLFSRVDSVKLSE